MPVPATSRKPAPGCADSPFVALLCSGPRCTQLKRLSPNATYTEARTDVDNAAITCSFAECLYVTCLLARATLVAHLRRRGRVLVQRLCCLPVLFCLRCIISCTLPSLAPSCVPQRTWAVEQWTEFCLPPPPTCPNITSGRISARLRCDQPDQKPAQVCRELRDVCVATCAVPLDRGWHSLTYFGHCTLSPSLFPVGTAAQAKKHRTPGASCWSRTEKACGSFPGWPRARPSPTPPTAALECFATRVAAPCRRTGRKQGCRPRLLHRLVRWHSMLVQLVAILCAEPAAPG